MVGNTPGKVGAGDTAPTAPESQPTATALPAIPIVGIGASAGGLEAFETFFRACPPDTGLAFVLVPHLDPGHHSLLTEILQRCTAMPVMEALDRTPVVPDHVYVIPPNREMSIHHGVLQISEPTVARGQRLPIDGFLRSLAEDRAEHAIGIILSGTASDGTLGLRAIQGAGGVCMVQDPATAKYDGMPQSAIAAGYATHILAVEKMPDMLVQVTRHPAFCLGLPRILPAATVSGLNMVLQQVKKATGHDFSLYKKSTLGRRIERRMAQHAIDSMAVYARFLSEHPPEVKLLFKELLIDVTSFFRDPEAFVALKQEILPTLLAGKDEDYVFRVWVAGCASGEEAYSIAIALRELMDEARREFKVQIYATDLDDDAIDAARAGRYLPGIAQDLTPERLHRFFTREEGATGGYKVRKDLREMVVFAVQSVVKDPPFTKLDLLSCRNLMIYLEPEQQDRLIPTFHYALKPGGVLFLSTSESITHHPELFVPLNRKWKFYRAIKTAPAHTPPLFGRATQLDIAMTRPTPPVASKAKAGSVADLSNRLLLQAYAPASVTTDAQGNIHHVHGDTSRYLRPPTGPVTTNVVEMARDGLQLELRAAICAAAEGKPTLNHAVTLTDDGSDAHGTHVVNISVRLLPTGQSEAQGGERPLLISFQDVAAPPARSRRRSQSTVTAAEASRIEHLERELAYSRENLQATIEEQQATNEELKSTNEELQSTNEELQSSNEELETSKEELQSLNEEAITVNAELNNRIEQMIGLQNDIKNLFDNVSVGTLLLDHDMRIRRFTKEVLKLYPLVAGDLGRPLRDIKSSLDGADLLPDLKAVLDTLIPCECEVRSTAGAWYLARMQPYRTLDNVIEGVVLTFTDVSASHEAAAARLANAQLARELAEGIVDTVSEPLLVLDGDLQVVSASGAFYRHFHVGASDTVGRKIYYLGNGQWAIPALQKLLENILPQEQALTGYVVEHDFPGLGRRRMVLNARRIVTAAGRTELILLAMVAIESLETP